MSDEKGVPEEMGPSDEPVVEPAGEPAPEPVAPPEAEPAAPTAPEPVEPTAPEPVAAAAESPAEMPVAPPAPLAPPVPEPMEPPRPPVPPMPPVMPPAMPVVSAKPRADALFFTIGFVAALVFLPIAAGALGSLLSLNVNLSGGVALALESVLVLVVIAAFAALMVAGRKRDNNRLRSFGKGGLWAAIAVPLVMLAAVGSCLVLVGQNL